jgi:hypothetical protein
MAPELRLSSIFNFQFSISNFRFGYSAVGLAFMIFVGLAGSPLTCWGQSEDAVEPPVAHRPADFNGAIGSGFRVRMRATPTQVQAEEPLILTVTITGKGNLQELQRPDLRRRPRFAQQFHIENLADRYLPAERTRAFDYRMRPRHAAVREIPLLPFVFFNPKILPPEKGYQTAIAPAIPITVKPRAQVSPTQVEGTAPPVQAPDSVYQLVNDPAVLRCDPPFALPGPWEVGALLIGPPLLGGWLYIFWRRRHPDSARQTRKRHSQAAQHALKAFRRLGKLDTAAQAQQTETILAEYLRQRLDLRTVEPTPAEVAQHLEQAGSSTALANAVAHFFGNCDAARFAPGFAAKADNWTATATQLVVALEEESWPSQLS